MRGLVALLVVGMVGCSAVQTGQGEESSSGFPEGYIHWHKLSGPLERGSVYRYIYANDRAFSRTGSSFPLGTVLVKVDHAKVLANGKASIGNPIKVMVMRKIGPAARETGGWLFEAYDPQTHKRLPKEVVNPDGCVACHLQKIDNDYVFSRLPKAK